MNTFFNRAKRVVLFAFSVFAVLPALAQLVVYSENSTDPDFTEVIHVVDTEDAAFHKTISVKGQVRNFVYKNYIYCIENLSEPLIQAEGDTTIRVFDPICTTSDSASIQEVLSLKVPSFGENGDKFQRNDVKQFGSKIVFVKHNKMCVFDMNTLSFGNLVSLDDNTSGVYKVRSSSGSESVCFSASAEDFSSRTYQLWSFASDEPRKVFTLVSPPGLDGFKHYMLGLAGPYVIYAEEVRSGVTRLCLARQNADYPFASILLKLDLGAFELSRNEPNPTTDKFGVMNGHLFVAEGNRVLKLKLPSMKEAVKMEESYKRTKRVCELAVKNIKLEKQIGKLVASGLASVENVDLAQLKAVHFCNSYFLVHVDGVTLRYLPFAEKGKRFSSTVHQSLADSPISSSQHIVTTHIGEGEDMVYDMRADKCLHTMKMAFYKDYFGQICVKDNRLKILYTKKVMPENVNMDINDDVDFYCDMEADLEQTHLYYLEKNLITNEVKEKRLSKKDVCYSSFIDKPSLLGERGLVNGCSWVLRTNMDVKLRQQILECPHMTSALFSEIAPHLVPEFKKRMATLLKKEKTDQKTKADNGYKKEDEKEEKEEKEEEYEEN